MKEKLKAVDLYKVAGLALLFWLCVSVNSLGGKVKDLRASLNNSLGGVSSIIDRASLRTKTVEVRNPLEGFMEKPFKIRN